MLLMQGKGLVMSEDENNLVVAQFLRSKETNKARVPVMEALHGVEQVGHQSSTSSHGFFSLSK